VFFVFRRNDGYVGSINVTTADQAVRQLRPYTSPGGTAVSYEILLETASWDHARDLIGRERASEGYPRFEWAQAGDARK
jgi:hypothetical protein